AAGAWVFNGGLYPPSTATVVRSRDGEVLLTDGPYVEGKEHVGGLSIVEASDLDGALEWARKLAGVLPLPIEVRPIQGDQGRGPRAATGRRGRRRCWPRRTRRCPNRRGPCTTTGCG